MPDKLPFDVHRARRLKPRSSSTSSAKHGQPKDKGVRRRKGPGSRKLRQIAGPTTDNTEESQILTNSIPPTLTVTILRFNAHLISSAIVQTRNYDSFDYFVVQLQQSTDPQTLASKLNATFEGPLGELPNHFTFSCPKAQSADVEATLEELRHKRLLRKRGLSIEDDPEELQGLQWHQKQELKQRHVKRVPAPPTGWQKPRQANNAGQLDQQQQADKARLEEIASSLDIHDPIFLEQWHLLNYIQKGIDVNVTGVWQNGVTGQGVTACVIDDGLDFTSNDLKPNYYANGSWDFNDKGPEPKPRLSDDRHGTRCAGEIAAARNDVCGVGMAYDSQISGVRILSAPISDEDEALSINYHYQENDIYSCSWGPPDDGQTMEAPGLLIKKAMVNGVQQGRDGRGSVFVFAAGNGAAKDDNCNFDGYTNSIYSITTGAIDRAGDHPYYSEKCSALLVVTPSSGHSDAIHTTDVGFNTCYNGHGGTSAAGPLMVGAVALALSARPELTWRDLQYLTIDTSVPIHLDDAEWQDTATGKKFSHTYGYGKLDTYSFVEAAKTFELVKPQAWYHSPWIAVAHDIPEGDKGLAASFDVTPEMLENANLARLEHVTVTMNVNHTRRGDLSVELKSPQNTVSRLSTSRKNDNARSGYTDWTFMSVVHWGESGVGTWTVIVKDTIANEHQGQFSDWRLNLWGESIDGSKQELHPLPDEHDDDHEIATASVTTTSVEPTSPPTDLPEHPTDHPERPTKPKPTSADTTAFTTPATTTTPTAPSVTSEVAEATHTTSESYLAGFLPTFGVSKKTQIWIYGSIVLMAIFGICLFAYFWQQKRKRQRNSRENYEFEMVNDEDLDDARQGLTGSRRRKRGGELYDAFAGESDEEVFSDEDDDDGYHDRDTPDHDTGSGSGSASQDEKR
ncbi:pheromone processing endoprotease [Lithohypha guttulata]|uniref:Pheromone processing endoprotease n=1 Tax=Lithohypha guttulata TaxID=1690604 RepID=A0AAN7Y5U5_9EURO|nr:pheromone processing endoprotease [Lithohypha guttulata]